jgi:hypothetical protein
MPAFPRLRIFVALLLLMVAGFAAPVMADTDYSDIWYEGAAAGGWGVSFEQNDNVIFVQLLVYDADNKPTWLGGTMLRSTDGNYAGSLYTTNGDYYGNVPYSPGVFSAQAVGTVAFMATDVSHGLLSYSVNGVVVNKLIQRQSLAPVKIAGQYLGAEQFTLTGSGCRNVASPQSNFDQILVTQAPSTKAGMNGSLTISIYDQDGTAVCSMQGAATQIGKVIDIPSAASTCPGGNTNSVAHVYDMRVAANAGLELRWTSPVASNCTLEGRINALKTN